MQTLRSFAAQYDPSEDRVLAAINAGSADACAFWLTRRLLLGMEERAVQFLQETSQIASYTPTADRAELAVMERQVAVAITQNSITKTSNETMAKAAVGGELAIDISVAKNGENFVLRFRGSAGGEAQGVVTRPELQTILQIMQQEVSKTNWRIPGVAAVSSSVTAETPRRFN